MCYNGVVWLSKVCYNVSIADSVYYNKFCIADMLHTVCISLAHSNGASSSMRGIDKCFNGATRLLAITKQQLILLAVAMRR